MIFNEEKHLQKHLQKCVDTRQRSQRQWTTQKRLCPRWLLVNPLQLGAKHRFENPVGVDLSQKTPFRGLPQKRRSTSKKRTPQKMF